MIANKVMVKTMEALCDKVGNEKIRDSRQAEVVDIENYRHAQAKSDNFYHVSASGNESSHAEDIFIITLFKHILFPTIIACSLILFAKLQGDPFSINYQILTTITLLLSILLFKKASFFQATKTFHIFVAFRKILVRWSILISILATFGYATGSYVYFNKSTLTTWIITTPLVLFASQLLAWLLVYHFLIKTQPIRKAVIIGANQLSYELSKKINGNKLLRIFVAGFFDDRDIERSRLITEKQKLGGLIDLPEYVKKNSIEIIYVCLPVIWHNRIKKLLDELRDTTASIYFVPDVSMFDLIQTRVDQITGIPIVAICETPFYGFRKFIKRISDFVIALMILGLIWPVMLFIGIGVKLTSLGPIIFKQRRYGLNGEEIMVYKFRTMHVCEDGSKIDQAKRDDNRITPFGRFLRRTSLDELPQFINVLMGSMSIVGPRPHAVAHNESYRKLINGYMIRHKVKPGITGWAQVNGFRGETPTLDKMSARVDYDLDYLRNWSLALDFWIIFRTILLMFSGDHKAY